MILSKADVELLDYTQGALRKIEIAGRTCYKSESKITNDSAKEFVSMLISRGHEAMLEHANLSMRFICDRGVTHEIVRHRLFSYAQESTRYCNYKGGVEFIIPSWFLADRIAGMEGTWNSSDAQAWNMSYNDPESIWFSQMIWSEMTYQKLLKEGWKPQQARSVLPNSLKTEIVVTGNIREWRHFFKLRCAKAAHPQMREVAHKALIIATNCIGIVFDEYLPLLEE